MRICRASYISLKFPIILLATCLLISCLGCVSDLNDNKPPPPSDIKAIKGDFQVTISWNNVPGASSYNLYYSVYSQVTKKNANKISSVTSPFTHRDLSENSYCYMVTSVRNGWESLGSNQVRVSFLLEWDTMRWDQNVWGD